MATSQQAIDALGRLFAPSPGARLIPIIGDGVANWVGLQSMASPPKRSGSSSRAHCVELDAVHERVLVDRARVCGALAQRLAVGLAGSSDVRAGDRRERDKLDGIDLNLTGPDPIAAALLDPWPLPQPDRERNVSREDVVAQLAAELHARNASS
jgi:hypothetical protein